MTRAMKLPLLAVVGAVVALLAPAAAGASTYSNPTPIRIGSDQGPATPYPSPITVSGLPGAVAEVRVTLHRVSHTYPHDIDVLLSSPNPFRSIVLMTELCGDGDPGEEATGQTFAFAHGAPTTLARGTFCPSGTYAPSGLCCIHSPSFPPPAPQGLGGLRLNVPSLTRLSANGTWRLFVVDNDEDDAGTIAGGWSLELLTDARCSKKKATLTGTAGPDVLVGTPGRDVILGLGGNDTIRGLGGKDVICGGPENDRLVGGKGSDRLLGGPGRDTLLGKSGKDALRGNGGRDRLRGGRGSDNCNGGKGADRARSCEKENSI